MISHPGPLTLASIKKMRSIDTNSMERSPSETSNQQIENKTKKLTVHQIVP